MISAIFLFNFHYFEIILFLPAPVHFDVQSKDTL